MAGCGSRRGRASWLALALVALAALPCTCGAESSGHIGAALDADDACLGEESCAVNALQLQRQQRRGAAAAQLSAEDPEGWIDELEKLAQMLTGTHNMESKQWTLADQFAGKDFNTSYVANDEVEKVLPFASTGSQIPAGFHGVFWLDQYHASSIAQQPEYQSSKPFSHPPSDETVVTFGDYPTGYDAETNCVGPVPNYGGEKGHWTFLDTVSGRLQLSSSQSSRLTANFCFDSAMENVEVQAAVLVPLIKRWVFPPSWMFVMRMQKRPWGWDRVTTVGPNVTRFVAAHRAVLEKVFPAGLMRILDSGDGGAFHYPFIRIVDGDGHRTKYYSEYLAYVSGENNGNSGRQAMGLLGSSCDGSPWGTVSRRRRFGRMCSCRRRTASEGPQASSDGKTMWKCDGDAMVYAGEVE